MQPDNKLKFLVVDDIGTGRSVLEAMLSRYGEVETASGGEAALSAYREAAASGEMYDLLLLDIDMPGMDGITTLKKLREFEREEGLSTTKTVMQTASSKREHVQAAVAEGAVGYLLKPLNFTEVVEMLVRLDLVAESERGLVD